MREMSNVTYHACFWMYLPTSHGPICDFLPPVARVLFAVRQARSKRADTEKGGGRVPKNARFRNVACPKRISPVCC